MEAVAGSTKVAAMSCCCQDGNSFFQAVLFGSRSGPLLTGTVNRRCVPLMVVPEASDSLLRHA